MNKRDSQHPTIPTDAINQIASDNTSGAAVILRRAGAAFSQLNAATSQGGSGDLEGAQRAVLETSIALARAQPEMTPLLRLASTALTASLTASDARDSLNCAERAALSFIEGAMRAASDASSNSAILIREGTRVLTHSRSSTVLAALVKAKRAGRNISVVVTESRPMLEGRAMAAALAGQVIPVTLIADAAASLALDGVNLVIVGADKVTPVDLINKIGTRMICLAARERGLPVFATCDSSKFISEDYFREVLPRSRSAGELWPEAPAGVSVVNCYFEPTPLAAFAGVVTEDGVLSIDETTRRAEQSSIDIALVRALELQGIK